MVMNILMNINEPV